MICKEDAYAFKIEVHEKISENVINQAKMNLDTKLSDIGLKNGILEKVNGAEIREWIEEGSKQEDEPLRFLNHFYNPLNSEGLGDIFHGDSSFVWASAYANEWSWRIARDKYHEGLTVTTDMERKNSLADSFRAIGQVMHLVQDLASPPHVRNDAHPLVAGYEEFTFRKIKATSNNQLFC